MLTMVKGFGYYVRLMFVPYPLNVEYLFPIKYAVDAEVLFYGLLLVGIVYLGFKLMRSHAMASFGIFLFFLSLVPVSNLLPLREIINERFLYLSVAGFGMVLGQITVRLATAKNQTIWRNILSAGFICLLASFSFITINRNLTWKDQYTFTVANLNNSPQSAMLHFGMGKAYALKGEFDRAVAEFELCLRIDPQYAEVLDNIEGTSYKGRDMEDLLARYRQSVQKRVDLFEGLSNLGVAYFNKGEYAISVRILEKAAELKPGDVENQNNLAYAYAYTGQLQKAIKLCKYILSVRPDMLKTRYDLGLFYGTAGMPQEAKKQFQIVLEADPNNEEAKISLEKLH
jgi:tetratricopeptide (TPR) repeat protein